MKVCNNCNNIVDDSAKFCNKCGSALEASSAGNTGDNLQQNTYKQNQYDVNQGGYQPQARANAHVNGVLSWFKNRLLNQSFEQADDNFIYSISSLGIILVTMLVSMFNLFGKKIFAIVTEKVSGVGNIFGADIKLSIADLKDGYQYAKADGVSAVANRLVLVVFISLIVCTVLVALMNYLGNRDIKKFINGMANKTVLSAPLMVIAFILSFIPYFQFKGFFAFFVVCFAIVQYNIALQDIMFNDRFGKKIKVYIAMLYSLIVYLIMSGVGKAILKSLTNAF